VLLAAAREAEKNRRLAERRKRARATGNLRGALPQLKAVRPFRIDEQAEAAAIARRGRLEELERERATERLIEHARIPVKYRDADLNALDRVPAKLGDKKVLEPYRDAVGRLLRLYESTGIVALLGKRGAGKTWMACGLAHGFCRRGRSAVYLDALDYFIELKGTYGDSGRSSEASVEARYLRPQLLILDEMHERGETAWEDRMLTRLVNKRYAAELSTVLISNLEPKTFAARVGESIADRIRDGGGLVTCSWPSLRGHINQ
jgi:DNA replication protein DnaC